MFKLKESFQWLKSQIQTLDSDLVLMFLNLFVFYKLNSRNRNVCFTKEELHLSDSDFKHKNFSAEKQQKLQCLRFEPENKNISYFLLDFRVWLFYTDLTPAEFKGTSDWN